MKGTELAVSPLCLGTVHYGTAMDTKAAEAQLSLFAQRGGNFIDTAHVYGDWVPGLKGRSERVIGSWLKETGMRHKIIVSTKGAHPELTDMSISRAVPQEIIKDLEESLRYLDTDYIDLYFLHRDNPLVPVEELLGCLENARSQGKIRYYGCSNWTLPRIKEAHKPDFPGFVCNQLMYGLADINSSNLNDKTLVPMDRETYDYHRRTGMNVMAYTSLSKGFFTKKASGKAIPSDLSDVYANPSNQRIFAELTKTARALGCSLSELELAFLMHQDFTVVPIVSFSNPQQLEQGVKSCVMEPDGETVRMLRELKRYSYSAC